MKKIIHYALLLASSAVCLTLSSCGGGGGGGSSSSNGGGSSNNSGGGESSSSSIDGKTLTCSVKTIKTDVINKVHYEHRNDHTLTFSGNRVTWTRRYYGPNSMNGTAFVATGTYTYKKSGNKGTLTINGLNFKPSWYPTSATWVLNFHMDTMGVTDVTADGQQMISNWAFTLK